MLPWTEEPSSSRIDSPVDNGHILVSFPENYRLYEHIKKTVKDGKLEVKSKTHAAGGNDRQDAYLYGHPAGRRKRFRSPNDFFPHLLWLCTDESGDPDNCSCKICSPEDLENLIPAMKIKQEKSVSGQVIPMPMSRQTSQQGPPTKQEQHIHTPLPAVAPAAIQRVAPLPLPKNSDQELDLQYNSFLYRAGEVAWFKRGQTWGISLVLRRWSSSGVSNNSKVCYYQVQPLCHPYEYKHPLVIGSDEEMRPWLAWSVPKFTMALLNGLPDPARFDSADWHGMSQSRYGKGEMDVDASILAAKAIDSTYTVSEPLRSNELQPGIIQTLYNVVYLGAEKIWVGDPIRLQNINSSTDVMVVRIIVEVKRMSGAQVLQQSVQLMGDLYHLAQITHANPQIPTPAAPNSNPNLPQRMTEDLSYRNARSINLRGVASYWKFTAANHRVDLNQIKGRWYECSLLLPIVDSQRFQEANLKGEFQESTLWMNARGDCLNSNRASELPRIPRENVRKETRKEAVGRSIPPRAEIKDGTQPPQADNVDPSLEGASASTAIDIDPRFETADDSTGQPQHDPNQDGALDDLMNLDSLDSHSPMPGFGQQYNSQGQSQGYF